MSNGNDWVPEGFELVEDESTTSFQLPEGFELVEEDLVPDPEQSQEDIKKVKELNELWGKTDDVKISESTSPLTSPTGTDIFDVEAAAGDKTISEKIELLKKNREEKESLKQDIKQNTNYENYIDKTDWFELDEYEDGVSYMQVIQELGLEKELQKAFELKYEDKNIAETALKTLFGSNYIPGIIEGASDLVFGTDLSSEDSEISGVFGDNYTDQEIVNNLIKKKLSEPVYAELKQEVFNEKALELENNAINSTSKEQELKNVINTAKKDVLSKFPEFNFENANKYLDKITNAKNVKEFNKYQQEYIDYLDSIGLDFDKEVFGKDTSGGRIFYNTSTNMLVRRKEVSKEEEDNLLNLKDYVSYQQETGNLPTDKEKLESLLLRKSFQILQAGKQIIKEEDYIADQQGYFRTLAESKPLPGLDVEKSSSGVPLPNELRDIRFMVKSGKMTPGLDNIEGLDDVESVAKYNSLLNEYEVLSQALIMNYDPTTLDKESFGAGFAKGAAMSFTGQELLTDQDKGNIMLDELEFNFPEVYDQIDKTEKDEIRESTWMYGAGEMLPPFIKIAAEFALTRKIAGSTLNQVTRGTFGGAKYWRNRRAIESVSNNVANRYLFGTGAVGRYVPAITNEALVIEGRNLIAKTYGDERMSPLWAIGGVGAGVLFDDIGKAVLSNQNRTFWNAYSNFTNAGSKLKIPTKTIGEGVKQNILRPVLGATTMKIGTVGELGIELATGEIEAKEFWDNVLVVDENGKSHFWKDFTQTAGTILAMRGLAPLKAFRQTVDNVRSDIVKIRKSSKKYAAKQFKLLDSDADYLTKNNESPEVKEQRLNEKVNKVVKQKNLYKEKEFEELLGAFETLGLKANEIPENFDGSFLESYFTKFSESTLASEQGMNLKIAKQKLLKELSKTGNEKFKSKVEQSIELYNAKDFIRLENEMTNFEYLMENSESFGYENKIAQVKRLQTRMGKGLELDDMDIETLGATGFSKEFIKLLGIEKGMSERDAKLFAASTVENSRIKVAAADQAELKPGTKARKKFIKTQSEIDRLESDKAQFEELTKKNNYPESVAKKTIEDLESQIKAKNEINADIVGSQEKLDEIAYKTDKKFLEESAKLLGINKPVYLNETKIEKLFKESKLSEKEKENYKSSDGWYDPEANTIYINEDQALKVREGKNWKRTTVGSHELLHAILKKAFKDSKGNVTMAGKELIDAFKNTLSERELKYIDNQINAFYKKTKKEELDFLQYSYEEYLNLFVDHVRNGNIERSKEIDKVLKDNSSKFNFETADGLKNFIYSFIKSSEQGKLRQEILDLVGEQQIENYEAKQKEKVETEKVETKKAEEKELTALEEMEAAAKAAGKGDVVEEVKVEKTEGLKENKAKEQLRQGSLKDNKGGTYKIVKTEDNKVKLNYKPAEGKGKSLGVFDNQRLALEATGVEFVKNKTVSKTTAKTTTTKKAKKVEVKGQKNIEKDKKNVGFAKKVNKDLESIKDSKDATNLIFDLFKGKDITIGGNTFSKKDLTIEAFNEIKNFAANKGFIKISTKKSKSIESDIDTKAEVSSLKFSRSTPKERRKEYNKRKRKDTDISNYNEDIIYEIIKENESLTGVEEIDRIVEGEIQKLKGELYSNNIGRITNDAKRAYDKGFGVDAATRITMDEFMSGFTLEFNELIRTYLNKVLDGQFRTVPFGAYVAENLFKRYPQILNTLKKQFEGAKLTGATESASEKRDLAASQDGGNKQREERDFSIRKKLGLNDDFKTKVFDKVTGVMRGRIPAVNSPEFKSKLEKEFERELFNTIREDVFGFQWQKRGAREVMPFNETKYDKFIRDNFLAIYEKLPLSVLNNMRSLKSGESLVKAPINPETGVQQRFTKTKTSQPGLFLKYTKNELTEIIDGKEVVKQEFLDYFINPKIGRKSMRMEGLAKILAKEIAFDAVMEVVKDPAVFERMKDVYEMQDIELLVNELEVIGKQIDRNPNLKFSSSVEPINRLVNESSVFEKEFREAMPEFRGLIEKSVKSKENLLQGNYDKYFPKTSKNDNFQDFKNYINGTIENRLKLNKNINPLFDTIVDYIDSIRLTKDLEEIVGFKLPSVKELVGRDGTHTEKAQKVIVEILKDLSIQEVKDITANLRKSIYGNQVIQILTSTANLKKALGNKEKTWNSNIIGQDFKSPTKSLLLKTKTKDKQTKLEFVTKEEFNNRVKTLNENTEMTKKVFVKFLKKLKKKYSKVTTEDQKKEIAAITHFLTYAGGMQSILRTSYKIGKIQDSVYEIIKNGSKLKSNEEVNNFIKEEKNRIVLEHRPPANILSKKIVEFLVEKDGKIKDIESFLENEAVINIVDKIFDNGINKFYKSTESISQQEYLNPRVLDYYVKELKKINVPENKMFLTFDFINKDGRVEKGKKLKLDPKAIEKQVQQLNETKLKNSKSIDESKVVNVAKAETNEEVLSVAATIDAALEKARNSNLPVKKIRVFDFDDTLAQTKSNVLYTMPDGKKGKLTAEEFAKKGDDMAAKGAKWDFSEFNKVVDGKKGPLFKVAEAIQKARGTEDVFILTARAAEAAPAIKEFLKSVGLDIPIENITGLGDSSPFAKSQWVVEKAAEGYNDFYFADDAYKNVKAVQDALSVIDVKSKVQQAHVKFSKSVDLSKTLNDIIEAKTGIPSEQTFDQLAKGIGKRKGKRKLFLPYSAEDFLGLIYPLVSKGKLGDAQLEFFNQALFKPFARAMNNVSKDRVQITKDWKTLKKELKNVPKNLRKEVMPGLTYENAVRIYAWEKQGVEVEGVSEKTIENVWEVMQENPELQAFADQLIEINKGDGYQYPGSNWLTGNITSDLYAGLNGVKRAKYLEEWTRNKNLMFTKENMLKLEAAYGPRYVESLKDILRRMETGVNRPEESNRIEDMVMNWVNGSVGVTMFLNTRSAVLQTISTINYLNWKDNNPYAAGKAMANIPQYAKDWYYLITSDFMKDRRSGLKINVSESEVADAARKGGTKGIINLLLQSGFSFTKAGDAFAIATGGATFYRNRIKKYEKEGMSTKEAERIAFEDFREITEQSQQSARPDKISAQQSNRYGRVILAFANTPMQYNRIIKRAVQDIANGRGDLKSNISKIAYYGLVQNLIFNTLQQALFALAFDDEEDEDKAAKTKQEKMVKVANGMTDSVLRGMGYGGAAISVIKNVILKLKKESEKEGLTNFGDVGVDILGIAPPIQAKIRRFQQAGKTIDYNKKEIEEMGYKFSLDNPSYQAGAAVISGATNIPLDRLILKMQNIEGAMNSEYDLWQRLALGAGWNKWNLGIGQKEKEEKKAAKKAGDGIVTYEEVKYEKVKYD